MKQYTEYKKSEVPFLDFVPKEWRIIRLRYLGDLNAGGVDKKIVENEPLFKSVHYMNVYSESLHNIYDSDEYLVVSATKQKQSSCSLLTGDVLFTSSSETPEDIGHSCVVGENLNNTLFGYHLMRFRPSVNLTLAFEKYLFGVYYIRKWFAYRAVGMTRYGISNNDFSDARVLLPPIQAQQRIADYLDRKIAVLDSVISDKQKLIELLQEKRIALICQTVTKGLDRSVPMKGSGVAWLGDIPKHWQVRTNHQVFAERNVKSTQQDDVLLSVTKYLGVILQSQAEELNLATIAPAETTEGYKLVRKGDLVMNIMRAKDGSYGISPYDGVISPAYCIYYTREKANSQYLFYLFKTPMYIEIFKNFSTGIAEHRMRLYPVSFFKIPVVIPPFAEQDKIVEHLDKRTKAIDDLIGLTQHQIEKLKEYRQSVISEAVTGKVATEYAN
ncbi:MAG: restriction endonuclease subunit S [Ethanoligenens sp.]